MTWFHRSARRSFSTLSKVSASTKSPPLPVSRRDKYWFPFLPRAITCANRPVLFVNSRDDLRPPGPRKSNSQEGVGPRMITREQIHELAQFEDEGACALSFYFQPTPPRNKAHKEEAILTKDLAREVLRQLESRDFEGKTKAK